MIQGLVDTHCHAISDDLVRYPLDPIGGTQSDWSATRPVTHPRLIAAMDAAGVPQAVVVQASTAYGHDNRYTVESVAAHPGRLAGLDRALILGRTARRLYPVLERVAA